MTGDFSIVPFCEQHVDGMAALEQVCFSMPWSAAMIADELTNEYAMYFVAEHRDSVVGYAGIHILFDEGHITNVAVSPDFRRNGIASALLDKMIRVAVRGGVDRITLEVRESNAGAIALYVQKGFEVIARRNGYYSLPYEDGLLMQYTKRDDGIIC